MACTGIRGGVTTLSLVGALALAGCSSNTPPDAAATTAGAARISADPAASYAAALDRLKGAETLTYTRVPVAERTKQRTTDTETTKIDAKAKHAHFIKVTDHDAKAPPGQPTSTSTKETIYGRTIEVLVTADSTYLRVHPQGGGPWVFHPPEKAELSGYAPAQLFTSIAPVGLDQFAVQSVVPDAPAGTVQIKGTIPADKGLRLLDETLGSDPERKAP